MQKAARLTSGVRGTMKTKKYPIYSTLKLPHEIELPFFI